MTNYFQDIILRTKFNNIKQKTINEISEIVFG